MKKIIPFVFVVILLSACGSTPPATHTTYESTPTPVLTQEISPSTETQEATPTSTPTSEPIPTQILFDRAGFQQFAITHSLFQGFLDFKNERSFTQMASALSPDGTKIAIAGCWGSMDNLWKCETQSSGFLVVLSVDTGDLLAEIPLGKGWPGNVVFGPENDTVYYTTHERKVASWDLNFNQPGLPFFDQPAKGTTLYPDLIVSPDGRSLAAVVVETLYVWDMQGNLLKQIPADQGRIKAALNYSVDGSVFTVYSPGATGIDVYDTAAWTLTHRFDQPDITGAVLSPDGLTLVTVGDSGNKLTLWDVVKGQKLQEITPGLRISSLAFNPSGDLLVLSGMGALEKPDDYDVMGAVYETQTWTKLTNLYSFIGGGSIKFAADGARMAVFGDGLPTVWEAPDVDLVKGYETVQQFQSALSEGDYAKAASYFTVDENELEYLVEVGLDPSDVAGSFQELCEQEIIFCLPIKELVMMGRDWYDQAYLVRLETITGETFTSPKGAQIIHLYTQIDPEDEPKVIFLPMDF